MKVFAVSDLHLSFVGPPQGGLGPMAKPREVFGGHWQDCYARLCENWRRVVGEDDAVLVAGDISWAMTLEDCGHDFAFLAELPGRKILVRGNHDYWWQAIKNVRRALPPNVYALQNDSLALAGHAVCGCRGWNIPGEAEWLADDEKIYRRELLRLEMALNDGSKHGLPLVAMLHFPPLLRDIRESGFMELLRRFQVKMCVYGHLHGPGIKNAVEGDVGGTEFCLSSMDHLRFMPRLLWQEE